MVRVPGASGKYGLSTLVVNADGSIVGEYGSVIFIGPGVDAAADVEGLGADAVGVFASGAQRGRPSTLHLLR
jgi:hypothetical protein